MGKKRKLQEGEQNVTQKKQKNEMWDSCMERLILWSKGVKQIPTRINQKIAQSDDHAIDFDDAFFDEWQSRVTKLQAVKMRNEGKVRSDFEQRRIFSLLQSVLKNSPFQQLSYEISNQHSFSKLVTMINQNFYEENSMKECSSIPAVAEYDQNDNMTMKQVREQFNVKDQNCHSVESFFIHETLKTTVQQLNFK